MKFSFVVLLYTPDDCQGLQSEGCSLGTRHEQHGRGAVVEGGGVGSSDNSVLREGKRWGVRGRE